LEGENWVCATVSVIRTLVRRALPRRRRSGLQAGLSPWQEFPARRLVHSDLSVVTKPSTAAIRYGRLAHSIASPRGRPASPVRRGPACG